MNCCEPLSPFLLITRSRLFVAGWILLARKKMPAAGWLSPWTYMEAGHFRSRLWYSQQDVGRAWEKLCPRVHFSSVNLDKLRSGAVAERPPPFKRLSHHFSLLIKSLLTPLLLLLTRPLLLSVRLNFNEIPLCGGARFKMRSMFVTLRLRYVPKLCPSVVND